jgi:hypothetical protein
VIKRDWLFQTLSIVIAILFAYQFLRVIIAIVEDMMYWYEFTRIFEDVSGFGDTSYSLLRIAHRNLTLASILDLLLAVFFFHISFNPLRIMGELKSSEIDDSNAFSINEEVDSMRRTEICGTCVHFNSQDGKGSCSIRNSTTTYTSSCFTFDDGIYRYSRK